MNNLKYKPLDDLIKNELEMQAQIFEQKKQYVINNILKEKDKEIERLNNEIKTLLKENDNKEKVIIKQNNIIDELEEHLLAMSKIYEEEYKDIDTSEHYKSILDKLKELKEGI